MENNSELTCYNCKYFVQHYIKYKHKFRKVSCGHCINENIKKGEKAKNIKRLSGCQLWKPTETAKNEDIENIITETAEKLRQIARFLQSD